MTEERKKYLANISKEERVSRVELSIQKNRLRYLKELIKYSINTNDKRTMLRLMQDTRFIIKYLKKQLPAPRKEIDIGLYWSIFNCPICRTTIPIHASYCLCCGQKLR